MELWDIHTHIVPHVDDGAADETVMSEMLKRSFAMGVRHIFLTPHYSERYGLTADPQAGFLLVQEAAKKISDELEVYPGNELYYSSSAVEKLASGEIRTLAGSRYVLTEFSSSVTRDTLKTAVHELMLHGYQPIVAHAERYSCLYDSFVNEILNMGVHLQINANSILAGSFRVKSFCKKLLRGDMVSFIASDCHNLADRSPNLGDCAKLVAKKYGKEVAYRLFCENPEQVLLHKEID